MLAFIYELCVDWPMWCIVLRKEDIPMKRFLRDVLVTVVATILAAVVVRLLNL